ncbi:hypothetical protein ZWY2020_014474 [Hordeum vulgare]|nr:hypothetical protein ZWY2020_014474 [Hordeum vulgare]
MSSWNDGEERSEEEFVGMDMELWENLETTVDASLCGKASDPTIKCRLHLAPCSKYVAFEGIHTGRRFYGCGVQDGIDCGVSEWVDAPWSGVLQRFLMKVWEMFHEENHGTMLDHQAHQEETAKLKQVLDSLGTQYNQLVEDVTKLFDWRDAEQHNKQCQNDEDLQKKEMDVDKQMQKLAIDKEKEKLENDKMKEEFEKLVVDHKELKCIFRSQGEIIRITRKERGSSERGEEEVRVCCWRFPQSWSRQQGQTCQDEGYT